MTEKTVDFTQALDTLFRNLNKTAKAVNKAKAARSGTYNGAVDLAIQAGSWSKLEKAFADLFTTIRTDGRMAVAVGAKKRKKPAKNGDKYIIPGGVMTVKSVLKDAFEYGVDLYHEGEKRPMTFNAIRKDVQDIKAAIQAEKDAASASPDDLLRANLSEYMETIQAEIGKAGDDWLTRLAERITALVNDLPAIKKPAKPAPKKTAKKAATKKAAKPNKLAAAA